MRVRATTFWEHLGVLKYIQKKYKVWSDPKHHSTNWTVIDEELWRDFPDDYLYVRTHQRLTGFTYIDYLHGPQPIINTEDT